ALRGNQGGLNWGQSRISSFQRIGASNHFGSGLMPRCVEMMKFDSDPNSLRCGFVSENRANARPIPDAELRKNTLDMIASGESANAKLLGHFLIRQPTRHEPSDFDFASAQV